MERVHEVDAKYWLYRPKPLSRRLLWNLGKAAEILPGGPLVESEQGQALRTEIKGNKEYRCFKCQIDAFCMCHMKNQSVRLPKCCGKAEHSGAEYTPGLQAFWRIRITVRKNGSWRTKRKPMVSKEAMNRAKRLSQCVRLQAAVMMLGRSLKVLIVSQTVGEQTFQPAEVP